MARSKLENHSFSGTMSPAGRWPLAACPNRRKENFHKVTLWYFLCMVGIGSSYCSLHIERVLIRLLALLIGAIGDN